MFLLPQGRLCPEFTNLKRTEHQPHNLKTPHTLRIPESPGRPNTDPPEVAGTASRRDASSRRRGGRPFDASAVGGKVRSKHSGFVSPKTEASGRRSVRTRRPDPRKGARASTRRSRVSIGIQMCSEREIGGGRLVDPKSRPIHRDGVCVCVCFLVVSRLLIHQPPH